MPLPAVPPARCARIARPAGASLPNPRRRRPIRDLPERVRDRLHTWAIELERITESETSWLVFGRRRGQPVVLKVARTPGDEWQAGSVVAAFRGQGMVRALEWAEGAMLLDAIQPAVPLLDLTAAGRDAEAGAIFADVINAMRPGPAPSQVPTVNDWGLGFERYRQSGETQIPSDLLDRAHETYRSLAATQGTTRLLHGDLHHENILLDAERGWLAVDPKGVIGELEFELGAWLRNPNGYPELLSQSSVGRRIEQLQSRLPIDPSRALGWAFAQGVLSAVWTVEYEGALGPDHAGLALARNLHEESHWRDIF